MSEDVPVCPPCDRPECEAATNHFHELAKDPWVYLRCHCGDGGNVEHRIGSKGYSRCFAPQARCEECGKVITPLAPTIKLCLECYDILWDSEIDAEADRLAGY